MTEADTAALLQAATDYHHRRREEIRRDPERSRQDRVWFGEDVIAAFLAGAAHAGPPPDLKGPELVAALRAERDRLRELVAHVPGAGGRLYACVLLAAQSTLRGQQVEVRVELLRAADDAEARRVLRDVAERLFPAEDGWDRPRVFASRSAIDPARVAEVRPAPRPA